MKSPAQVRFAGDFPGVLSAKRRVKFAVQSQIRCRWEFVRGVSAEHPKTIMPVGDLAPDFDLPVLIGGVKKRFHLKEALAEKKIVLAFYPTNWEATSAKQL